MPFPASDVVSEKECLRKEEKVFIGNDARWTRRWDVDMFAYLMSFETNRLSTTLDFPRVLRSFFDFPNFFILAGTGPAIYGSPRSSSYFLAYHHHTFGHEWAGELGTTFRWLRILGAPLKMMVLLENYVMGRKIETACKSITDFSLDTLLKL